MDLLELSIFSHDITAAMMWDQEGRKKTGINIVIVCDIYFFTIRCS